MTQAQASLAKRDFKAAEVQLKAALAEFPNSGQARYLLGLTLIEQGNPSAAEVEFRKAKDTGVGASQWAPPMAKALLTRGQFARVFEEFGSLQLEDADAQAGLRSSVAAAKAALGQREEATQLIEKALAAAPRNPEVLMVKARLLAAAGDLAQATETLESLVASSPDNADAWQLLGNMRLYGARDLIKASDAYAKVLSLRPAHVDAHAAMVFIALAMGDRETARQRLDVMQKALPGHPATRFLAARVAFLSREFERARDLTQQLLKIAPDNVMLLEFAGAVELQLNSTLQAEKYLSKALALAPTRTGVRRLLGDAYVHLGRHQRALEVLKPNISEDAADVASLNIAASAHLFLGDVNAAQMYFSRANRLAPNDPKVQTALALTMMAKGQRDAALIELRSISSSSADVFPDLSLISALMRQQRFDEALTAIDGLERKQPDKPTASALRGMVYLNRRDFVKARQSFEQAATKDSTYFPAISSLAAIDIAEGKLEQAESRYVQLIDRDPKNTLAYLALAQLKSANPVDRETIIQLLNKATQASPMDSKPRLALVRYLVSLRDVKSALAAAQSAAAAIPDDADVLDALGGVQLLSGESNQGIATFGKLVALQPDKVRGYLRLANAQLEIKDYPSAEKSFKRALEIAPGDLAVQRGIIASALRMRQPDTALEVARAVQRQRAEDGIGHLLEGDIHSEFKNYDAAIKAYRAGLARVHPGRLPERLYVTLFATKSRTDADRFAEEWLRGHSSDTAFLLFLAYSAARRNELLLAERYYSEISRAFPNSAAALNDLAWIMARQSKSGAIAVAEKAAALQPNNAAILDTVAFSYAANKQYAKAINAGKAVVVAAPDEPQYRFNLATYYADSGEKALAISELKRIESLGPKFPHQDRVQEMLKSLK